MAGSSFAVRMSARLARRGSWCMLVAALVFGVAPAFSQSGVRNAAFSSKPDPEYLLIGIYKELASNNLREAQAKADALVAAYPNFRLGHLIRGDLLLMHTRPVSTLGAVQGDNEKLKQLRDEAMVRLKSLRQRPDPDLVPRAILQLRPDQKNAIVVDTKRARLYIYENRNGRLHFRSDYYISHGKLGVHKVKSGDQKTPIGVYYITGRVPGPKLPDFYGTGALPLNYPNEWDRLNGRSGSGIWLHGVPSDSYSRPPLSSDGCVVLTNPDINKLYETVDVGKTPVVIADGVEFVNETKWNNDRSVAMRVVEDWRRNLENMDFKNLSTMYSNQFRSERGDSVATWLGRQQQILNGARNLSINLRDMSLFLYPGRNDLMVVNFMEEATAGRFRHSVRKRQYWVREGTRWKVLSEGIV